MNSFFSGWRTILPALLLLAACSPSAPPANPNLPPLPMPTVSGPVVVTHIQGKVPHWTTGTGQLYFGRDHYIFTTPVQPDGSFDFALPSDTLMNALTYLYEQAPYGCTDTRTITDPQTRIFFLTDLGVVRADPSYEFVSLRHYRYERNVARQGDLRVSWIYSTREATITGATGCNGPQAFQTWNVHLVRGWNQVVEQAAVDRSDDYKVDQTNLYSGTSDVAQWDHYVPQ